MDIVNLRFNGGANVWEYPR